MNYDELVDERRSWLFYLAEISLRRTIDDTLWLFYHKGEGYWIKNEDVILHQYINFTKQIHPWYSHLPPSISFAPSQDSENEFAMFLQSRFLDWQEMALRPLVFIFLHRPAPSPQQQPPTQLNRYIHDAVAVASEAIQISGRHHRHGGTWLVARRVFSSALLILAVILKEGQIDALPNWLVTIDEALNTLKRWGTEAPDLKLMGDVLQRMVDAVLRQLDAGT